MANTIDADLLIDTLSSQTITTLGSRLAPLKSFSRDFSTDKYVQQKSHQITVVTGGSTTQTNPSNFETGDSTTASVGVTINHYAQPFHITSAQLNQRFRIEQLAEKNLQTLADKVMDVAMTPVTTTNFTASPITVAQASIASANLKSAWAAIGKAPRKNILLDSVAFSQFLPTNLESFKPEAGAYGFDGFHQNTRWTGAEANTYGFACGPEAVAVAAGIPDIHPAVQKLLMESRIITIDNLGLSVQLNVWGSAGSRAVWASYDLFFGSAFGGDVNSGVLIKSA